MLCGCGVCVLSGGSAALEDGGFVKVDFGSALFFVKLEGVGYLL